MSSLTTVLLSSPFYCAGGEARSQMSLCEGVPVCVTASHVKSICKHVRLAARKIITQWVILYIRHQNTNFHTQTDGPQTLNKWLPLSLQRTRWISKFLFSDFSNLTVTGSHYAQSHKCQLWILFTFLEKTHLNNPEWLLGMTCRYVHMCPGQANDGWPGRVLSPYSICPP